VYGFESHDRAGVGNGSPGAVVYAERARQLMLPFTETVRPGAAGRVTAAAIRRGTFAMSGDGTAYIAPDECELAAIETWLAAYPAARDRLWVTTPRAIRAALTARAAPQLLAGAVDRLATRQPQFSARRTLTHMQATVGGVAVAAIAGAAVLAPQGVAMAIDLAAAALFLALSTLRFVAAGVLGCARPLWTAAPASEAAIPVYTVLAPLHREAELAGDLVRGLLNLDWPRDKLDVKLLVEAGDGATIAAARRATQGTPFEVVVVPPGEPRTKPRALAYALPLSRGTLVTVFDAEDRPHRLQLRRAWETFRNAPRDLGCVQAALVIDNENDGWLARLFAIEYAALFDGLLPALAALGIPVPLGGTSNHFRLSVLKKIGGWDCYNVTEDADVGVRLARFGYRTAVIDLPTLEEAPTDARIWFRQRTRWFKGWLQTFLVHTRQPLRLVRELGAVGALGFMLTSAGILLSAMVYPINLTTVVLALLHPLDVWESGSAVHAAAIGIYFFNLAGGHAAMALLAVRALRRRGRTGLAGGIWLLPAYWLFMSLAAYWAVVELALRPHHWAKTPHRRYGGRGMAGHVQPRAVAVARQEQALPVPGG